MPTDQEVFALRDEEQQRKRAEREAMLQQKVWEKGAKQKPPIRDFDADRADEARAVAAQQSKLNLVAAATRDRRKEKENMADFIAKKREMFLVQMSLDTKRAEIVKLEVRTAVARRARAKLRAARGVQETLRSRSHMRKTRTGRRVRGVSHAGSRLDRAFAVPSPGARAAAGGGSEEVGADAGGGRAAVRSVPQGQRREGRPGHQEG